MQRKARVVYRKSDGLCLQQPGRPPCFARPDLLADDRLIERQVIPEFGGQVTDYVVVERDYPGEKPPWDFKWTPRDMVPSTDDNDAVRAWRARKESKAVFRRIRRRRMEFDLKLAREAGDTEAVALLQDELKRL